ncbi:MAG: hypothetical protein IT529_08945 [Burkholderiales bacterium]|nr:hypothetical protein [Burkholderiales bacterium]
MSLKGISRRLIASLVALMVLTCQSTGFAQVRLPAAVATADSNVVEAGGAPCSHDAGDGGYAAECRCDPASPSTTGAGAAEPDEAPAFPASAWPEASTRLRVRCATSRVERVKPPPLSILHCRLRN